MRITEGRVEYVGVSRGNNQGFPDRDDFGPQRQTTGARRFAVFGDSFTAAQHLGQNWADRVEDLAHSRGEALELLNFSIDGGGLANWWSILRRIIEVEGYKLDGVIFAVYGDDLHRTFFICDDRGAKHHRYGYWPGWNPVSFPETLSEAERCMRPNPDSYILSPEDFERTLQGRWPASARLRPRPILLTLGLRIIRTVYSPNRRPGSLLADPHRQAMIAEIAHFLVSRNLSTIVVHIPDRDELLNRQVSTPEDLIETKAFAMNVDATYLDGSRPFQSLSRTEILAQYLPHDAHWNQAGSNRFARFMADWLSEWLRRRIEPGAVIHGYRKDSRQNGPLPERRVATSGGE
jgi:hypothetical protein